MSVGAVLGEDAMYIHGEGVAELKFWNFNVPYKAYMALTNVKTLQLWKFCNTLLLFWHTLFCK